MENRITANLTPPTLYHAVSQGALAVEIRTDDLEARELCQKLMHWETQWKCFAERACLRVLEGGCSVPVGVESVLEVAESRQGGLLTLSGCVTSIDGKNHVEHTVSATVLSVEEAETLGAQLAKVLIDTGAKTILDNIAKHKQQ